MARICLAVMIAGQLQFPQGAGDRLPAIILQHGSGADDDYVPVAPCRAYFERLHVTVNGGSLSTCRSIRSMTLQQLCQNYMTLCVRIGKIRPENRR